MKDTGGNLCIANDSEEAEQRAVGTGKKKLLLLWSLTWRTKRFFFPTLTAATIHKFGRVCVAYITTSYYWFNNFISNLIIESKYEFLRRTTFLPLTPYLCKGFTCFKCLSNFVFKFLKLSIWSREFQKPAIVKWLK